MKKYLVLGALLLALVAVPVFAQDYSNYSVEQLRALIAELTAQYNRLVSGGGSQSCYNFTRDLYYWVSGSDVLKLQEALERNGFGVELGDTRGAYFGESTASAVVRFQAKYGILQTGYVGPVTRAKLNALYGCSTPVVPPVIPPTTTTGSATVISGVSGPTSLRVGERGTWKVRASDADTATLYYWFDRGDGTRYGPGFTNNGIVKVTNAATNEQEFTINWTYNQPGTYNLVFYVGETNQSHLATRVARYPLTLTVAGANQITAPTVSLQVKNLGDPDSAYTDGPLTPKEPSAKFVYRWTSQNAQSCELGLVRANGSFSTVVQNQPANGSASWRSDVASGSHRARIRCFGSNGQVAEDEVMISQYVAIPTPTPTITVPPPTNLVASDGNYANVNLVRLTWQGVNIPASYEVWRAPSADGPWTKVRTTSTLAANSRNIGDDDTPTANTVFYYKIIAVDANGNRSADSNVDSGYRGTLATGQAAGLWSGFRGLFGN